VWCRVDDWTTRWQCLLAKGEGSHYRIVRRSNDDQAISYAGGSPDIFGGAINDGAWHHITAVSEAGENTSLYPALSYRRDQAAIDADLEIEFSSELTEADWRNASPELILIGTRDDPDGIPRHTYRLNRPFAVTPRFFFRLKVTF
jgi:hypothetical protein